MAVVVMSELLAKIRMAGATTAEMIADAGAEKVLVMACIISFLDNSKRAASRVIFTPYPNSIARHPCKR